MFELRRRSFPRLTKGGSPCGGVEGAKYTTSLCLSTILTVDTLPTSGQVVEDLNSENPGTRF